MEKTTDGKRVGTRRGIPLHSNNPGQHSPAWRHVGYILHILFPPVGFWWLVGLTDRRRTKKLENRHIQTASR